MAPLLCAGITTYSPIMRTKITKGDKVAVAGFGGLGHMAVQYAVKLGTRSRSLTSPKTSARTRPGTGAVKYVNVNNAEELKGLDNTFRVIISTIPAKYDVAMYVKMLKMDGDMVVGRPSRVDEPATVDVATLVFQARRKVWGSQIGGIRRDTGDARLLRRQ